MSVVYRRQPRPDQGFDTPTRWARELLCLARTWVKRSSPMFPPTPARAHDVLTEGWEATVGGRWRVSAAPVRRARLPHRVHLGPVLDPRGNRNGRRRFAESASHRFNTATAHHRIAHRKGPRARPDLRGPVRGGAGNLWYVRTGGVSTNGGSSAGLTPDRSGTDMAVTNASTQVTSATAAFGAGDVGKGINVAGVIYRIATFTNSTTIQLNQTYAGATGTGKTWAIGGALPNLNSFIAPAGTASLTLVQGGDTIYIGAGTYRATMAPSLTSPTSTLNIVGDVDGVNTGDAGEVRFTAYTTNDTTAPSATVLLALTTKNFLAFSKITFIGGNANVMTNTSGSHDCSWTDCTFLVGYTQNKTIGAFTAAADTAMNYTVERCVVLGGSLAAFAFTLTRSAVADYNAAIAVRNCFVMMNNAGFVTAASTGASAFFGGGLSVTSCTIYSALIVNTTTAQLSSVYPLVVTNCVCFIGSGAGFNATTLGQVVEDYNVIYGSAPRSSVNAGAHSISDGSYAPLIHLGQEYQYGAFGRPVGAPTAGSPLLGFGNGFVAVAAPGTMADDATVGTITWANVNNAKYPDGTSSTGTTALNGDTTHYLKATNFGFNLPSDAVVQGVLVEVLRSTTVAASNQETNSVKLVKGGVIGGNDKATATNFTTTLVFTSYGALNDLWGNTLTATDINASTFGAVFSIKQTSATAGVANVDFIRIAVAYTSASSLLTVDVYGRPRPAGGASALNAVGALERGNTWGKETTTVRTGSTAISITGPGFADFTVPVDAASTTITVYMRFDSTYAGTKPQMKVTNGTECGVADATATCVGAANAWEQLTLSFTPTAKGIVTIRLLSNDTNGGGKAFADDFAVS